MKLPNGDQAVVEMRKLSEYCLSPRHPRGRHKARVFASAIGITEAEADVLRNGLLEAARTQPAVPGAEDQYGMRYTLDFEMSGPAGKRVVRSFWIIRAGEFFPRFVTCFVI